MYNSFTQPSASTISSQKYHICHDSFYTSPHCKSLTPVLLSFFSIELRHAVKTGADSLRPVRFVGHPRGEKMASPGRRVRRNDPSIPGTERKQEVIRGREDPPLLPSLFTTPNSRECNFLTTSSLPVHLGKHTPWLTLATAFHFTPFTKLLPETSWARKCVAGGFASE